jgi:tetratricopeptide (TPR) repeat protein
MSIFISYSRKDQDYVNKLVEALAKQELPWWVDNKIDYGDKWTREIKENIKKCQVFLLVMSPSSEESDWVQRELTFAQHLKKPIFPLLLDGEIWFQVIDIQTTGVLGGELPPASFFNKIRSKLNNKTVQLTAEEWFNLGDEKRESGDYRSAIADYDQAIQLKPDYADAYYNRGIAKSDLGDYQGAIIDYNQVIQLKPDYADAYYNRGNTKDDLGDKQGAIADYNQAIKIEPDYASAYYNRGIAKKNLGDKQGAIADYNQAIKIEPDFVYAYFVRGIAKKNLEDYQGAIADYTQAIKLKPDYADAFYFRGSAKDDLGAKQGAISDYNQAAQLYSQQGDMKWYLKALDNIKNLEDMV